MTAPAPVSTLVNAEARTGLAEEMDALVAENLPQFMMWASPGNWRWHRIYERYPDYQVAALDGDGAVVGAVHAVPVAWRGEGDPLPGGYDDVLVQTTDGNVPPAGGATCLLSISLRPAARGKGLPAVLLAEMRRRAAARGHSAVIAPLRPTGKATHPRVPMAAYAAWTDARGEPADPWLRTHVRLGARVLGIAERSLVIVERGARWEAVAGRPLPPGLHDVPGALVPVEVDAQGIGRYAEPNVWICHPVVASPPAP